MKNFIAIALIGFFSLTMVGTAYASFDSEASIELKKDFDKVHLNLICDGVTPSVAPKYGKMVTVLPAKDLMPGAVSDVRPNANDPPTIRML